MNVVVLILLGLVIGLVLAVLLISQMLRHSTTRIWLSDWVNWSNNQLPDDCYQIVRHGKWIARPEDEST